MGWIQDRGTLLIAFKGTSTFQDVLQDLKQAQQEHALLYPWMPGVAVHTGFLQQLLGALGLHDALHTADSGNGRCDVHDDGGDGDGKGQDDDGGDGENGQGHATGEKGVVGQEEERCKGGTMGTLTEDELTEGALTERGLTEATVVHGDIPVAHGDTTIRNDSDDTVNTMVNAKTGTPMQTTSNNNTTSNSSNSLALHGTVDEDTLLRAATRLTGGVGRVRRVILCGHSLGGSVASLGMLLFLLLVLGCVHVVFGSGDVSVLMCWLVFTALLCHACIQYIPSTYMCDILPCVYIMCESHSYNQASPPLSLSPTLSPPQHTHSTLQNTHTQLFKTLNPLNKHTHPTHSGTPPSMCISSSRHTLCHIW